MFSGEIFEKLKIKTDNGEFIFPAVTIVGRAGVWVEGHKGIFFFSDECVKFRIKSGLLTIEGNGLSLSEVGRAEAAVTGIVTAVKYE